MGWVIENFATDVRLTLLATAKETGGEPLKGRPAAAPQAEGLVLHQTAGVLQLGRNRPCVRVAVRTTDMVLPVKVGTGFVFDSKAAAMGLEGAPAEAVSDASPAPEQKRLETSSSGTAGWSGSPQKESGRWHPLARCPQMEL